MNFRSNRRRSVCSNPALPCWKESFAARLPPIRNKLTASLRAGRPFSDPARVLDCRAVAGSNSRLSTSTDLYGNMSHGVVVQFEHCAGGFRLVVRGAGKERVLEFQKTADKVSGGPHANRIGH